MANLFQCHIDLEDNEHREIDNPLAHIEDLNQLDEDARQFARRVNPEAPDFSLWEKAARVARDPLGYSCESVPNLTEQEENVLKKERSKGFWSQPKTLRVTTVTLCLGAIIQGWTQTGGNGANQSWPKEFGLKTQEDEWKGDAQLWIFSSVNAVTYLAAGFFGCWLSDPLQSWLLGRRGAIFVSGLLILASVVGGACTHTWQQLLACRAILGLGMGAKASVVPIMGAEVSPPHLRGALVMNWQLMDAFGIFLGFTSNLVVSRIGHLSWRFQIASAFLPTVCLLSLIWTIPESPRFLLKKGQLREAYEALLVLRETPLQAARELYYANAQIQAEVSLLPVELKDTEIEAQSNSVEVSNEKSHPDKAKTFSLRESTVRIWRQISRYVDEKNLDQFQRRIRKTNYFTRLWQLFRDKRTKRATIAALVVIARAAVMRRIYADFFRNVLAFYSSTFFENIHNNQKDIHNNQMEALWLSWGLGLANFLFTFPTYYFIDNRGRRFLLLATYPGMALSMLAACLSFLIPDGRAARPAVIAFFIFIFFFFYSWGQGPVASAYSSEIFPLLNREQGMSFAVFINLLGAGLLTLFVPQLTEALQYGSSFVGNGQRRLLAIFAGLNVLSFLLIFFLVPETAGATLGKEEGSLNYISLEELNYIFGVSTIKHIRYQLEHVLPWALRRVRWNFNYYILRKDVKEPDQIEELYTWVNVRNVTKKEKQPQTRMLQNDEEPAEKRQQVGPENSLENSSSNQ